MYYILPLSFIFFAFVSAFLFVISTYIFLEDDIKNGMEWVFFDTAGLRSILRNWRKKRKGRILMYFGLLSASIAVISVLPIFLK